MSFTRFFVPASDEHKTNGRKHLKPPKNIPPTVVESPSSDDSETEQNPDLSSIISLPLLVAIYPHYPTFDHVAQCYNGLMINNSEGKDFLNAIKADINTEHGREFVASNHDHYFLENAYGNTPSYWIDYIFIYDKKDIPLLQQYPKSDSADDVDIRIEKPVFYKINSDDPMILTLDKWNGDINIPLTFCARKKLTACVKNLIIEISKISAALTLHKYDAPSPSRIALR